MTRIIDQPRQRDLPADHILDEILALRRQGYSFNEIGDALDLSRQQVRQIIERDYHPKLTRLYECRQCGKRFMRGDRSQSLTGPPPHFCSAECVKARHTEREWAKRWVSIPVAITQYAIGPSALREAVSLGIIEQKMVDDIPMLSRRSLEHYLARHNQISVQEIQAAGRKSSKTDMPTRPIPGALDCAYMAGLFDGGGSLSIRHRTGQGNGIWVCKLHVTLPGSPARSLFNYYFGGTQERNALVWYDREQITLVLQSLCEFTMTRQREVYCAIRFLELPSEERYQAYCEAQEKRRKRE